MAIKDQGPKPHAFDLEEATVNNTHYRDVVWTGRYLQLTLMSIPPGKSVGLEKHPETDQFLRLDSGQGKCVMGPEEDQLEFEEEVSDGWAVMVPAGTWHDLINTGDEPMNLYAVYAPVHHTQDITQDTKDDADEDEEAGRDKPPKWTVQTAPDAEDESAD